jgi:predicted esterase
MRPLLALVLFVLVSASANAQTERYELGRRLKRFEEAWEKQPDAAARKRAAAILPDITPMFFALRFGDAGKTLDRARHLLAGADEPSVETQWLESLYAVPEKVLYTNEKEVVVTVKPFYAIKGEPPAGATATLEWRKEKPIIVRLDKFPVKLTIPLHRSEKKYEFGKLQFTVTRNDKLITQTTQHVTWSEHLPERIAAYRAFGKPAPATLETATLKDRADFLEELADGTYPESDVSILSLLVQSDWIVSESSYFLRGNSGQFLLSIPLDKNKTQPVRLFVPKGLDEKQPVPIVVALHGAGGSENLFFEGYGAGQIVKECEKRGWLLVAPRSPLGFGSGPPVKAIFDRLGERYPIDRSKVFLVGHSMGAAQAVALCQEHPGLFAAAAALGGGGGRVKQAAFAKLPFFIGVGDKDFALSGAKALAKALPDATYKEYPGIEHMLIVREALPDVFAGWDKVAK